MMVENMGTRKFDKCMAMLFAIIILSLAIMPMASAQQPQQQQPPPPRPEEERPEPDENMLLVKTAISFANMTLIILLIAVYFDIYRKIKNSFTFGLLLLLVALLMYAISSNPSLHVAFGYRGAGLGPFLILPDIFTTLALVVLFKISME